MQNGKRIFAIAAKLHYLPLPRVKRRHLVEQVLCGRQAKACDILSILRLFRTAVA